MRRPSRWCARRRSVARRSTWPPGPIRSVRPGSYDAFLCVEVPLPWGRDISEHEPFRRARRRARRSTGRRRSDLAARRGWCPVGDTGDRGRVCSRYEQPRPRAAAAPSRIGVASGGSVPTGSRDAVPSAGGSRRGGRRRRSTVRSRRRRSERASTCSCAPTVDATCAAAARARSLHDELGRARWPATSGGAAVPGVAHRRPPLRADGADVPRRLRLGAPRRGPLRSALARRDVAGRRGLGRAAAASSSVRRGRRRRSPTARCSPGSGGRGATPTRTRHPGHRPGRAHRRSEVRVDATHARRRPAGRDRPGRDRTGEIPQPTCGEREGAAAPHRPGVACAASRVDRLPVGVRSAQ